MLLVRVPEPRIDPRRGKVLNRKMDGIASEFD